MPFTSGSAKMWVMISPKAEREKRGSGAFSPLLLSEEV